MLVPGELLHRVSLVLEEWEAGEGLGPALRQVLPPAQVLPPHQSPSVPTVQVARDPGRRGRGGGAAVRGPRAAAGRGRHLEPAEAGGGGGVCAGRAEGAG